MNCKPGDLAVILKAEQSENVGRIVRCVRLIGPGELVDGRDWLVTVPGPHWVIEATPGLLWNRHGRVARRAFWDAGLRPITPPAGTVTASEVRTLYTPKQVKDKETTV
jgi:hypothetical protein